MYDEYAPRSQTIKKKYYFELVKRLRDAVEENEHVFLSSGDWLLNNNNEPAH